jgi:large subunit ribosomal protein L23
MREYLRIIRRPFITEKGTSMQEKLNQYAFEVNLSANKIEIKRAVEERFSVKVTKVRTMRIHGKLKTLGRFTGRRPERKKAIVTLADGDKIDLVDIG